MTKERRRKGGFGGVRLPIAGRYPVPGRRAWTWLAGLIGCAAVGAWFLGAFLFGGKRAVAPGPLSSNHAALEASCAACHTGAIGVGAMANDGCLVCHERLGSDRGAYGFAAHYVYASGDRERRGEPDREVPCAACHPEHRGRTAAVTAVADRRCAACHGFSSLNRGHPEFQFARDGLVDDPHLTFPHRLHVKEVRGREGFDDPQLACLYCHRPDPAGAGFAPIDFERSCGDCHLTTRTGTPRLPVRDPSQPREPGVETLPMIQARGGPGTRWAFFTDPNEYQVAGASVAKRPVYHADPWVMTNLGEIRRTLYPGLGLAELLATAVDGGTRSGAGGAGGDPRDLYREAIDTLRRRALELRGRPEPEVQAELAEIEVLLATAERRLEAGEAPPGDPFAAAPAVNPALTADQVAGFQQLALDLTEPCRKCHVVSDGAIRRVQKDQRTLVRARFDHRAHVVQVAFCADCHDAVPGLAAVTAESEIRDEPADVAATQNLPRIAVCQRCHTADEASNACSTCHLFHPESGRRADLLAHPPRGEGTAAQRAGEAAGEGES